MKDSLTRGEKLIYSTKISRRSKLFHYIIIIILFISAFMIYSYYADFILVSIILGILAVIYLIITEILLFSRKLYVTTYGVSERLGLLSRKLITIDMEDIINVTITQNIWQRILNYGEVFVNTTEQKKEEEVVFPAAANPEKVKKIIEEELRKRTYYATARQSPR